MTKQREEKHYSSEEEYEENSSSNYTTDTTDTEREETTEENTDTEGNITDMTFGTDHIINRAETARIEQKIAKAAQKMLDQINTGDTLKKTERAKKYLEHKEKY